MQCANGSAGSSRVGERGCGSIHAAGGRRGLIEGAECAWDVSPIGEAWSRSKDLDNGN